MNIAQIAPLAESVPPQRYGGTERVVSYLVESLVAQGHRVTLFASGDSRTSARLVPLVDRALRLAGDAVRDPLAHTVRALEVVSRHAEEFDVLHFHLDYLHFPLLAHFARPALTTEHGRLDTPELAPLFAAYPEAALVSISDSQRRPLSRARWRGTVYHGLPTDLYRPAAGDGGYLAFLARICPEKRVDRAIDIAREVGLPLKVAAKVDHADREYFEAEIRPRLQTPGVEFIGEVGEAGKQALLGGARALLFPIDWPEPFGLAVIEALACGTPVVAFRHGSMPEIIEDGRTGFLVDDLAGAIAAVRRVETLSRAECRAAFEARFTADRMAKDYVARYTQLRDEVGADERTREPTDALLCKADEPVASRRNERETPSPPVHTGHFS